MQTLANPIGFTAVDALRNFFSNEKSIVRMQRFFTFAFMFVVVGFLATTDANATTDTGGAFLKDTVDFFIAFMKGYGGLLAAMLGLVWTLFEAFVNKSLQGVAIAIGVSIIAVYGPAAVKTFFGATL